MATTSTDSTNMTPRPGDFICDYHEELENNKEAFEMGMELSQTAMQQYNIERGYKLCCLEMAEMTHDYYWDMNNYELHDMAKSVEIMSTNLATFVQKKGELQGHIQSSAQKLQALKTKINAAHDAACAMRNCINRHLNLEGGSDDGADHKASQKIETALEQIMRKSTEMDAHSQDAAEAMVKIAGIQTFTDVEGIQELMTSLSEAMTALHTNVTGYLSSANETIGTTQTEIIEVVESLNTEEFKRLDFKTKWIGTRRSIRFICDGYCIPSSHVDEYVESICKSMGGDEPDFGLTDDDFEPVPKDER